MRRHNDSRNLSFCAVMRSLNNDSDNLTDSQVFRFTNSHLCEVVAWKTGDDVTQLKSLYKKHYTFIYTGFDYLRGKIANVGNSPFLPTYCCLLECLKVFIPILSNTFVLYEKWDEFIRFFKHSRDFSGATGQIQLFLESLCLGVKYTASRVPPPNMIRDKCRPNIVFGLLLVYVLCLCESDTVDLGLLCEVVEELNLWWFEFDKDKKRRTWLVELVIQKIQFDDSEQGVQLFGLILLEHSKVCKNRAMIDSGVKFLLKKERPFILEVLRYLARKFPVVEGTNELDACVMQPTKELDFFMMQLQKYDERGFLQRTICITIESIISYRLLEDMLCDQYSHLIPAMNLIANAMTLRKKEANDCIANLTEAIEMLRNFDAIKVDHGPSNFMQAQALCLRALCHYGGHASSLKEFITDVDRALTLWSNNEFVDKNTRILHYTTNLLHFVFDVLITAHEDSHQLLERILCLFEKRGHVDMLWLFKSHHSHLNSERFHNQLGSGKIQRSWMNYEFLIEEGDSTENIERIVSDINKKFPWSMESRCLVAQLRYDLGERLLLMGDMNKALEHSREGCVVRCQLIQDSSRPPPNNQNEKRVYALLMYPIVAARVWSLTSEDFILPPNSNFLCYLMNLHQEATILEQMGNGTEALKILNKGKILSSQRGSSFMTGRFHAAIGKILRKSHDFGLAQEELNQAKIQLDRVTCTRCKLLLKVEIGKEHTKHMRKGLCSGNTEYDSVESMLQDESKNGCKCWKHTCGVSLLNILTEKGKDYIFKNDTRSAQDVFMTIINSVLSFSSPSQSQMEFSNFVKFFEFVEKSEIKFSYGTHVAQIIYMISWVAYKISMDQRNESGGLFSIHIMTLIPAMKRALTLCSEVPELLEKVAQLLAIMYFFSHKEITQSELSGPSHSQWAAFFHQLTVGSGVNYLFSQRLRQVSRVDDPDKILNRLTHRVDAQLDSFVSKFFEDLQTHTIIVISIVGNKYINLLKTKLNLPSDCGGLMMTSRLNAKHKPLVGLFPIKSGSVSKSGPSSRVPWGTNTIVDTIAPELKGIWNDFDSDSREVLNTLDDRISNLMRRMDSWFGEYKYIMLGEAVGDSLNLNLDYFSGFIGIGLENASLRKTSPLYGGQSERLSSIAPIILVLHNYIQMLPWERMASKYQEFYRMPSVSSTLYTCHQNWEYTEENLAFTTSINPFYAYYVINPVKNSNSTRQCENETRLRDYFKGLGLKGTLWEEHVGDVTVKKLNICDLFLYSGHGDGFQHIPEGKAALAKFESCAAAILMGCMSGLLVLRGPYTPTGAVLEYLLAGSPIVIGNLGKVTGGWALSIYPKLLDTCKYKMTLNSKGVGIGSCLVDARNDSKRFLLASNMVCYGVPTLIRGGVVDR